MIDRTDNAYREFQTELELDNETLNYSRRLHEDLVKKTIFKFESPYLIAAICIYAITCMRGQPKDLKDIAKVSHIKENALKECYSRVYLEIEDSLKQL